MSSTVKQTMMTFVDEAGYALGGFNESLKEIIRKVDGIPNATYLVKDGQVFVFDKLVRLVTERCGEQPEASIEDLARSLVPDATISAKEAVEVWGIAPIPYRRMKCPTGELMIYHLPFDATLPNSYQDEEALQAAFADLLVGRTLPGAGDFSYRGQSMTLFNPLDASLLPPRPAIRLITIEEREHRCSTVLGDVKFEHGFDPVPESLFDQVKALEASWQKDSDYATRLARAHADAGWARTPNLQLHVLTDFTTESPEHNQDDLAKLRSIYPELGMLSDSALYLWFDLYQLEVLCVSEWTAGRDDDFLFYLLGKSVERQYEGSIATEVGQWFYYALFRGDSISEAHDFARSAARFDIRLFSMTRRIARAMKFLAEEKSKTEIKGGPITTVSDAFRMIRKYNVTPALVRQDFAALEDGPAPVL